MTGSALSAGTALSASTVLSVGTAKYNLFLSAIGDSLEKLYSNISKITPNSIQKKPCSKKNFSLCIHLFTSITEDHSFQNNVAFLGGSVYIYKGPIVKTLKMMNKKEHKKKIVADKIDAGKIVAHSIVTDKIVADKIVGKMDDLKAVSQTNLGHASDQHPKEFAFLETGRAFGQSERAFVGSECAFMQSVRAFTKTLHAFTKNLRAFTKTVQASMQSVRAFTLSVCAFKQTLRAFSKTLRAFTLSVCAFEQSVCAFVHSDDANEGYFLKILYFTKENIRDRVSLSTREELNQYISRFYDVTFNFSMFLLLTFKI